MSIDRPDLDQRRVQRRTRLLEVGVDLLGAESGTTVSVRAACRAAGITERYFYESFTDRDTFVRAVYAEVGERARAALVAAVSDADGPTATAELAVRAFVELVLDHPAVGRVLLLAPLREPALGGRGLELAPSFVALVQDQLGVLDDPDERALRALGLVGALTSLFIGYLDGTVAVTRERLVRHCLDLLDRASRR
ncbi:TetR/AcrR family transcriptional regulator [Rhodococcus spelaei]|uniref:TetR/AcrR family transcriptional regulator n=1 Tax=Rhodococcus spelaei TaxID=2546320 RepID=A0A541B129_9NOCA|nr:TetR/AcrR family transcriptional regulator [Rhodococcus spelaei]TQF66010.1 TetR/AcrR family transcriptional regulator [Rhodococcus spelaei]